MKLSPVKSSLLSQIGWEPSAKDPNVGTLAVEFPAGKSSGGVPSVYHYDGVSKAQFEAFQGAESFGKHFLANIKGKHNFTKISPKPATT
jgi:hypothetical protein